MPEYRFKAIDSNGKVSSGTSAAPTLEVLAGILKGQGLFLMESNVAPREHDPAAAATAASAVQVQPARLKVGRILHRISAKEVTLFTSQLAIMVRSSLPILESLEILANQCTNPTFAAILRDIARTVANGAPLSVAFAKHPKVFDEVFISLLAAGEAGGTLDTMLERLALHLDFRLKLAQSIRSALVYPMIVIATALAVIAFLVVFVLPTFMEVFAQFSIVLPWPTRALIYGSQLLRHWWYVPLLGAAAFVLAFSLWSKSPKNARILARLQLRVPVLGELVRNIVLTRTLRTLAAMLAGGITILRALELAKASADHLVFHDLLEKVYIDVKEGERLSWSLGQSPYIPPVVVGMVATGEKTGTLPEIVNRVADFYESETQTSIKNLFSAMEPLFIVVLGFMVGGIAISVLLPMFNLAQGIQ